MATDEQTFLSNDKMPYSLHDRAFLNIDFTPISDFSSKVNFRLPTKHGLSDEQLYNVMMSGIEHYAKCVLDAGFEHCDNPYVPDFKQYGKMFHITQDYNVFRDELDLAKALTAIIGRIEPITMKYTITFA